MRLKLTIDANTVNTKDTTSLQQRNSPFNFREDLEEKEDHNCSQLRNVILTVKSAFEYSISSLTTLITSLAAKFENMDLSHITPNLNFPPKDNIKVEVSSIDEGSHSVVKNELETNHTENIHKSQIFNWQMI